MLSDKKNFSWWLVVSYTIVPFLTSLFSTIHVIEFFKISNTYWMAIFIAIAFEVGALAALAGLVAIDKINKNVVWAIFIILTAYQCVGNTYAAYDFMTMKMIEYPNWIAHWTELFGMEDSDIIPVKRILSVISGAIFPIISLCFLDILINYLMVSFGYKEPTSKKIKTIENAVEVGLNTVNIKLNGEELQNEAVKESKSIILPEPTQTSESEPVSEIHAEPTVTETKTESEEVQVFYPSIPEATVIINQEHVSSEEIKTDENKFTVEGFELFRSDKEKQMESMREPNMHMLDTLYEGGRIKPGYELMSYSEFLNKLTNPPPIEKINSFLMLCNYLTIFRLSDSQRIAIKTYDDAKMIFTKYMNLGKSN